MDAVRTNIFPEAQKIRNEVMNLIYRNGNKSVRIDSSRNLAVKFGVARSTVRLSLEKMTEEGYLITKKGTGTFTNPAKTFHFFRSVASPLIGLKLYNGDEFYYGPSAIRTLTEIMNCLAIENYNVRFLSGGCTTAEDVRKELAYNHVDAVLCYGSNPLYMEEAAKILPVLSIDTYVPGVSSIRFNGTEAARDLRKFARNETRKIRLLWAQDLASNYDVFKTAAAAMPDVEVIDASSEKIVLKELPEIPDFILCNPWQVDDLFGQIREIDSGNQQCQLILPIRLPEDLPVLYLDSPRRKACALASKLLKNLIDDKTNIFNYSFEYRLSCQKFDVHDW